MLTHTWPVIPALWTLRQEIDTSQANLAYTAKALPQKQQTKSPLMYFGEAVEEEMARSERCSERCRRGGDVERDGRGRGRKRGRTQLRGRCRRLLKGARLLKVQFVTLFPENV